MPQFAGIDIGKQHTFSCVLDADKRTFVYPRERMSLDETLDWLQTFEGLQSACIDGPPNCNTHRLAELLPNDTQFLTDKRLTEFQIGIGGCYSTPSQTPCSGATNEWMLSSFEIFDRLQKRWGWNIDRGGSARGQLIETHPTYAFKALLGCTKSTIEGIERWKLDPKNRLRRKHSKEGHNQRLELLKKLCDEMCLTVDDALLTKWKSRIDWADAAICAFMSCWHQTSHPELQCPGDENEGAIYLRIPSVEMEVAKSPDGDGSKPRIPAGSQRSASSRSSSLPPHRLLDAREVKANALILRLGKKKTGAGSTDSLSQLDTIDTITSSSDLDEFWLPIGSRVMPGLCRNIESVGGRLYLAYGQQLKVKLTVDECRFSTEATSYPLPESNPWPFSRCIGWLRVVAAEECTIDEFYLTSGDTWQLGFTGSQTSLLWALVPE